MWKHKKRRSGSFSQLGLEPNHTGLTVQPLFFLEELWGKRSDTQTFSNFSNYFKRVLKLPKTFSGFSKVKRLQLKLTNNLQNSYKIRSQHQVPKTWVKQHPKTKTHKNKRKSISALFHAQTGSIWFQIGSYLVPMGCKVQRSVPTNLNWFPDCSHAHALFQDRFKDVQGGSVHCTSSHQTFTPLLGQWCCTPQCLSTTMPFARQLSSELLQLSSKHHQLRSRLQQLS